MPGATSRVSSTALVVPPTQNTAPVIEFNCLYTHDIRRKSKRWQDGFLRLHTFNARAMVYDEQRNLVGDTHLTDGKELEDGDEIRLDKGGVLVQVADRRGETNTDLTGVCKQRATVNPASSSPLRLPDLNMAPRSERLPLQDKHRSLNALLGPKRGPIGKAALPDKSPFELRQAKESEDWADHQSVKRRRISKTGNEAMSTARAGQYHQRDVIPIDLTSDDDRAQGFSMITPTQATQISLPSRHATSRSDTRHTAKTSVAVSKPPIHRLSIAKGPTKRNTLACQLITEAKTIEQKQQQRVELRLAQMEQQRARATAARTAATHKPATVTTNMMQAMPPPARRANTRERRQHPSESTNRPQANGDLPTSFDEMELVDEDFEDLLKDAVVHRTVEDTHEHMSTEADFDGFDDITNEVFRAAIVTTGVLQPATTFDIELEGLSTSSTIAPEDLDDSPTRVEVQAYQELPASPSAVNAEVLPTALLADSRAELEAHAPLESGLTHVERCSVPYKTRPAEEAVAQIMASDGAEDKSAAQAAPDIQPALRRSKRGAGRGGMRKSATSSFKPPTLSTRVSSGPAQVPAETLCVLSTLESGPWSREAFDLFTWRPPDWDEAQWCGAAKPI